MVYKLDKSPLNLNWPKKTRQDKGWIEKQKHNKKSNQILTYVG